MTAKTSGRKQQFKGEGLRRNSKRSYVRLRGTQQDERKSEPHTEQKRIGVHTYRCEKTTQIKHSVEQEGCRSLVHIGR